LCSLSEDLLDSSAFDLLPLDLIVKKSALANVLALSDGEAKRSAREYAEQLAELAAQDGQSDHPDFRGSELLELAAPKVPTDALLKVRRRLTLPAVGLTPKQPKPKRKARGNNSPRGGSRPRPARRPGGVGRNG
jgi:hypothetical protein